MASSLPLVAGQRLLVLGLVLTLSPALVSSVLSQSSSSNATLIQTAQYTGDRLTNKGSIAFGSDFPSPNSIDINASKVMQSIIGFGGAFTEAASLNFLGLGAKLQQQILDMYWGSNGIGYTIGRVHMNR